jgi:hypothetical protein
MSAMKQIVHEANSPEAKRDAIVWLVERAVSVAADHKDWAEGCIQMAYDIDTDIAADEIAKRKK